MSIPTVLLVMAVFSLLVLSVVDLWRRNNKRRLDEKQFSDYVSKFSVSDYMNRMEEASLKIMSEDENAPKYHFVLWWGLDGLQLNGDGTSEWIRRENCGQIKNPPYTHGSQYLYMENQSISTATENRIAWLESQLQDTCVQQRMNITKQQLVTAIFLQCLQQ